MLLSFHCCPELPKFDSINPHSWIFKIEEYYEFFRAIGSQRVRFTVFTMDNEAFEWYHGLIAMGLGTSAKFLEKLMMPFNPPHNTFSELLDGNLLKIDTEIEVEVQPQIAEPMNMVDT